MTESVAAPGAPVGYLGRLLDLIGLVGEEPGLSVTEIGRRLGVPVSTASRLVALLAEREFVRRDRLSTGVLPGPTIERLGIKALQRLTEAGRFELHVGRLASSFGESVSLGLVDFGQIVLVARRESTHALRMVARVGDIIPPHRSAMGKAILAFTAPARALGLLASACDDAREILGRLEPELAQVRHLGYAFDEGEFTVGLRCVAAPFFRAGGQPAGAVSIAGPAARFTREDALAVVEPLLKEVRAISLDLGHDV